MIVALSARLPAKRASPSAPGRLEDQSLRSVPHPGGTDGRGRHSRRLASAAASQPRRSRSGGTLDRYGLMSRIGVPSSMSTPATRSRQPSRAISSTTVNPIGLGRCGERVANTDRQSLLLLQPKPHLNGDPDGHGLPALQAGLESPLAESGDGLLIEAIFAVQRRRDPSDCNHRRYVPSVVAAGCIMLDGLKMAVSVPYADGVWTC